MFVKNKLIAMIITFLFVGESVSGTQTLIFATGLRKTTMVTITVVLRNVNLRRDPSTDRPPILMLHTLDQLRKLGPCKNGFCKIETDSGSIGWVWWKNIGTRTVSGLVPHGFTEHLWRSFSRVQGLLDSLPTGNLVFTYPQEIRLGEEKTVKVVIAPDLKADLQFLVKYLKELGEVTVHEVKISTTMKCNLYGEHFKITPLGHEEQLISERDLTEWSFVIVPQESGRQKLRLMVSVVLKLEDGQNQTKDFPAKEETIIVTVAPLTRLVFFVEAEWHWMLTTLVVPLGAWIWKRRRGKRKQAGFVESNPKRRTAKAN